jgi:cellulose synthase (UDP-forming)
MDGVDGELVDISVGGVAVRFPAGTAPTAGQVELQLPGADPVVMSVVRIAQDTAGHDVVSCRLLADDWEGYRAMSLWLFHTPSGVVSGMPTGVPAVAATKWRRAPRAVRSFGQAAPVTAGSR